MAGSWISRYKNLNAKLSSVLGSFGRSGIRTHIAAKLILSFLLLIILVSAIFTVLGIRLISDRILAEAQETVKRDLNSAREIYTGELRHVNDIIRLTADRYIIITALTSGNINDAAVELSRIKEKENLDILNITDTSANVLVRVNNWNLSGDNQGDNELVAAVLKSQVPVAATSIMPAKELTKETSLLTEKAYFQFIDTPMARTRSDSEQTSGMILMAAAPIFDYQGNFIGTVYGGKMLNKNYEIVDTIKQTVFQDLKYKGEDIGSATIFQDDVRISTNVRNQDDSRAVGTRIMESVYDQVVVEGEPYIGRAYVVNSWYITAYEPIKNLYNETIGILYVGILEQKYTDIRKDTVLAFLLITFVGGIGSMIFAYVIAARILGPIHQLVSASNEVAQGNLTTRVEINSNDEIHSLAESFNAMAEALKKRDDQIKEFATRKIMEAERLALVGQLSANVAHELNNPLQGILTFSHLMLEEQDCVSPSQKNALEKIVGQANRCRDIIRGLLDFARQRRPDKTICNINALLENCVSLLEKQANFHNIKIVRNFQGDLPMTVIDPSQIERVFINLIVNAADAMDGNGQLTLITFFDAKNVTIEVDFKDTGCGIREENMDKIFDPFFTTKEVGHGTGLGLAISYGIIKSHRGNILVRSEEGKGSTFTVVLPVAAIEEGAE